MVSDGSGIISYEGFSARLEAPGMERHMRALEIERSEAYGMFALLDVGNIGEVKVEEFVAGFLRLRGQAKAIDLATLTYYNKRVWARWRTHADKVEQSMEDMKNTIALLRCDSGSATRSPSLDPQGKPGNRRCENGGNLSPKAEESAGQPAGVLSGEGLSAKDPPATNKRHSAAISSMDADRDFVSWSEMKAEGDRKISQRVGASDQANKPGFLGGMAGGRRTSFLKRANTFSGDKALLEIQQRLANGDGGSAPSTGPSGGGGKQQKEESAGSALLAQAAANAVRSHRRSVTQGANTIESDKLEKTASLSRVTSTDNFDKSTSGKRVVVGSSSGDIAFEKTASSNFEKAPSNKGPDRRQSGDSSSPEKGKGESGDCEASPTLTEVEEILRTAPSDTASPVQPTSASPELNCLTLMSEVSQAPGIICEAENEDGASPSSKSERRNANPSKSSANPEDAMRRFGSC
eukprot:gnl/TRDRNA2_/TRDRNA2_167445_c0_seq3.p1 gnl/TRDRNA2_/TRDRNA2_167445_c0~~gnl/TRDRNA2_/TRDRNA2_167445_c0_seq3.p1  ORF type:complete len:533 (+),score=93.82 gnl/TRDRNA2_/TRDRNA2_167445_c0_seq3:210-1601(+)